MFGGFDPFENIGSMMHRQMREMENMMDSMMDPFGMMGGARYGARSSRNARNQMIEDDPRSSNQRASSNQMAVHRRSPFDFDDGMMMPFGGGGFFGGGLFNNMNAMMQQMEALKERAANDPNSHVYTQSTVVSMAPGADGRMNYYEKSDSMRKAGDVKEVRNSLRDSSKGIEKMSIGHHIGDRGHVIEKKRGKDGRIVENQEFFGIHEDDARSFDNEWSSATRGAVYGGRDRVQDGRHQRHLPVEGPSRGEARERHASPYARAKDRKKQRGPIIEEAD